MYCPYPHLCGPIVRLLQLEYVSLPCLISSELILHFQNLEAQVHFLTIVAAQLHTCHAPEKCAQIYGEVYHLHWGWEGNLFWVSNQIH